MTVPAKGLARSIHLFRSFLVEQTDPDRFYGDLAEDSVAELSRFVELRDRSVLDVGAGPRQFASAFRATSARYVPVDYDATVSSVREGGLVASAAQLPLADRSVDVVFSSNLMEHVRQPDVVADEMVRVLRRGGILYLSYTNWLSPWGGHETSPWHWLGAERAIRRYERRMGRRPKNRVGETMFRISVKQGLEWARHRDDIEVLLARPRYLPSMSRHLLRVPGLREVLTWNLLLIVRRR